MLWPLLSLLTGFLVSFAPATAIIGVIMAFMLTFEYQKAKNKNEIQDAVFSFIGLTLGVAGGVAVYGKERYLSNWHSLWWVPALWAVATLIEMLTSKLGSKHCKKSLESGDSIRQ